jgi:hypothetical protein
MLVPDEQSCGRTLMSGHSGNMLVRCVYYMSLHTSKQSSREDNGVFAAHRDS